MRIVARAPFRISRMQTWLLIALLAVLPVHALPAQESSAELEFRRFLADHDRAKAAGPDLAFLERALANEYVYTGPTATRSDRAGTLAHFARKRGQPRNPRDTLEHLNVTVRVVGDMAVTTHDWVVRSAPRDAADVEPKTDRGRYTGVFERRDGRWQSLAEHDSVEINDEPWMLAAVARARRDYHATLKRLGDGSTQASLDSFLANGYTFTSTDGTTVHAEQAKAGYGAGRVRIESIESIDPQTRAVDNSTVIENATVRVSGSKNGAPFTSVQRHTTTWVLDGARWKIAADHASAVDAQGR